MVMMKIICLRNRIFVDFLLFFKVMDEADRILNMDFEEEVDKIMKQLSRDRRTMLFSATMTNKVSKWIIFCLS